MDDTTIRTAVAECKAESETFDCWNSIATYGHISTWDTSAVTNMYQCACISPSKFPLATIIMHELGGKRDHVHA
jgi:hypothetical protein